MLFAWQGAARWKTCEAQLPFFTTVCYNLCMDWNFSFGWVFLGLIIFSVGGAIVLFYRQIADNFASGVSSYNRVKLWGLIIAGVGLLIMTNLHTLLLSLFVNLIKP